jgi:hypothetical protein
MVALAVALYASFICNLATRSYFHPRNSSLFRDFYAFRNIYPQRQPAADALRALARFGSVSVQRRPARLKGKHLMSTHRLLPVFLLPISQFGSIGREETFVELLGECA